MQNYPANIWLIDESEFDSFTFTGGQVIYIVEEPNKRFMTHPAIVTAGALLPPFEAIRAEIDGNMVEAEFLYTEYLQSPEAFPYIITIIAAAIKRIPIGIMFGKDEMNFQFPKMFINFIYRNYGLVFGITNNIQPYIEESYIPFDLASLYNMNMIDYQSFMQMHPKQFPIHYSAISKLAYDINPIVPMKDNQHYEQYFESVKNQIQNNGKFLIDPLEALRDDYI